MYDTKPSSNPFYGRRSDANTDGVLRANPRYARTPITYPESKYHDLLLYVFVWSPFYHEGKVLLTDKRRNNMYDSTTNRIWDFDSSRVLYRPKPEVFERI